MARKPIRLAVVGGRRGGSFTVALEFLKKRLTLAAVCDLDNAVLADWRQRHPGIAAYDDFDRMLRDGACDAVIIATPMQIHAKQAVAAIKAGVHVLSEVTACVSHREALSLAAAVESSKRIYMMAENYTYMRPHMMVLNMVNKGLFGDLTYAEGMYLHDCRGMMFHPDGSLTWRGHLRLDTPAGNIYPTHSLGPIAQWLGLNRGDTMESVYSVSTPALANADYVRRVYPKHEGVNPSHWKLGDSNTTIIKTRLGRVIHLRFDATSARPHHMACHELQGVRACFRTQVDPAQPPMVWIDGLSPGTNPPTKKNPGHMQWQNLYDHAKKYEHPRWMKHMETANKAGHGGGDFFELEDFVDAIEGKAPSPIDVYDALSWSSIVWLSQESERTNKPVRAFDYRRRR
ncbi:MAG: Gfo/Idh/MocA family oxidoreductase [Planctomycetota bacterium]|nr:Gfo/Idh/MocA family oxidoreductase [Planctomycetota bacterium]